MMLANPPTSSGATAASTLPVPAVASIASMYRIVSSAARSPAWDSWRSALRGRCDGRCCTHRAANAPAQSPREFNKGVTVTSPSQAHQQENPSSTRVGLLGVGLMGSAMTHRLLNEGFPVVVWDRDQAHVEPLGARGADIADSAGDVVDAADIVITMLPTADVIRTVVEPVLEALASRIQWVGEAGMGSRLKLAANHWMITMVAALAETMHVCELMDLDQQQFIALLDGGPLGSSYALQKLDEMRRHEYPAGFPVRLAIKDLGLVREVAQTAHLQTPLLDAALERMVAVSPGHNDDDLAAVYELGR